MPHSWDDESASSNGSNIEETAISFLRGFAWLDLACGVVGAIFIWLKFASAKVSSGLYYQNTESVINPLAVGVGIAVLLQGIFIWAFFLVVASIASNIIEIRNNTTPKPQANP